MQGRTIKNKLRSECHWNLTHALCLIVCLIIVVFSITVLMDANFWRLLASWPGLALVSWAKYDFALLFLHTHVLS